uniref:Uncharacterized protein n=1 Tax=Rhizophora mucronata TaxID=61149 RepID=A0A2P2PNZ4_RHIMU
MELNYSFFLFYF